jgi:hypothetical protein
MPTANYPSSSDAEVIEVELLPVAGEARRLKLLVDSGFTGQSCLVLGNDSADLIQAVTAPAAVSGALSGEQSRAWVTCRVPEIGFQKTVIAILTDLAPLALPDGVGGMAGLSFLRQFTRWGAEQSADVWRFFLSFGPD